MTSTAHALVAGAIASKFSDPVTAGSLALLSHYLMDSIPHWDFGTNWRTRQKMVTGMFAILETVFAILVTYSFYRNVQFFLLTTTLVASLLPDWLETPWYIFFAHQKKHEPGPRAHMWEKISYRIYKEQNLFHAKAQAPLGIITQVVTVAFFLVLLG